MDLKELIAGCANNDRKAQESLYKAYFSKMYQMCLRYSKDEETNSAIVNDAFLSIFKNIGKFEQKGSFEGWLRRITFNKMADHFRKVNKDIKFLELDGFEKSAIQLSSDQLEYDQILEKVNQLTGSCKDVFMKYAIEGYSHKEIGIALNISEGTSKWYLSEARKKLQHMLSKSIVSYGES
jgi:RNA polymerase sigma factor (sigma-70 family)